MEHFGEILRNTREELKIDINQAERDTAISKDYIIALENENISAFPGEPYLVGFLRNYSEYLGLDPKVLISLYKAKVIQESPIPEELLKKEKPRYIKPLIISIAAAVVVVAIVLILVFTIKKNKSEENALLESSMVGKTYELSTTPVRKRIYKNDVLKVFANDSEFELKVMGSKDYLALSTPVGVQIVELGEEVTLDIDKKEGSDFGICVLDVSKTDENKGAEVKMWSFADFPKTEEASSTEAKSEKVVTEVKPKVEEAPSPAPQVETAPSALLDDKVVLFNGTRAYPFTVECVLRNGTLVRISPDGKESEENFYSSGQRITKTVNNKIRLWVANGNAVQISVIGDGKTEKLELAKPGQVIVKDIKWIKDEGRYKLVVIDVE